MIGTPLAFVIGIKLRCEGALETPSPSTEGKQCTLAGAIGEPYREPLPSASSRRRTGRGTSIESSTISVSPTGQLVRVDQSPAASSRLGFTQRPRREPVAVARATRWL